ncbi:hypothetical protein [Photobacterium kishitanii]|uniref:Uncharacterized protein n=1 Tax=Photobacterium kishitanii TaxID=318456 RepID=A0A0B7J7P5_9GAMM|nr:hypothetical protein [Photobacterium kishitanii]PSU95746.1 hypothetical protein C9J27_17910 [Photobacterium kishitanii]PSV15950.1 hypothetical protein C0W28_14475 [Photobacterium kishitanii]CEO39131.1 hypothetical protein PPBDW_I21147 [Photobacterium kishitanii]
MEANQNSTSMTRYDNKSYMAPMLYMSGFIEYYLWEDVCNEKYAQIVAYKVGRNNISLVGTAYFFSIKKYNHGGVFLNNVLGLDRSLNQIKIENIKIIFMLKAVLKHYNQLAIE